MSNYICKRCDRTYKLLGAALNHVEKKHNVEPPAALDNLWSRGLTTDGWYPAEAERAYYTQKERKVTA